MIETLATRKNDHYVTMIKNVSPKDILLGIEKFLKDLRTLGYKIEMASASKNTFAATNSLGLNNYFNHIVDTTEVVNSKPDPEVFLKAAQAVGTAPEKCIGVDDAADWCDSD